MKFYTLAKRTLQNRFIGIDCYHSNVSNRALCTSLCMKNDEQGHQKRFFYPRERGNVRNRFGESSQGLTKDPHSMHLYANFEMRNANLEMPQNKTDIVERNRDRKKVLKDGLANMIRYFRQIE